jgi:hypothetical protein
MKEIYQLGELEVDRTIILKWILKIQSVGIWIGFILVGFEVLTAVSTKMAVRTSETLVNFYQTTRRYNPEDSHLWIHLVQDADRWRALVTTIIKIMEFIDQLRDCQLCSVELDEWFICKIFLVLHATKACGGVEVELQSFLISAPDQGVVRYTPATLTPVS